ncbi:MAG: VOC family protein [SAR202 cluster bacterium]|nr:VOC family protein [SAR202 cluster bacterium]
MTTVLDHTIVPAKDQEESARWYSKILGFKYEGQMGPFSAARVNDTLVFDFRTENEEFDSMHYAFAMSPEEFDATFQRVKKAKIPFGDGPFDIENMRGPGVTMGAKGQGKAVYFRDPNGHVLEIKTY